MTRLLIHLESFHSSQYDAVYEFSVHNQRLARLTSAETTPTQKRVLGDLLLKLVQMCC